MIQIHSNGELTYDSRRTGYDLLALSYTAGLNKAGTATIIMPPGHPAYGAYHLYRDIITIHDHDTLVFRGRPLNPTDDFLGRRTIICEGERSFFRDALMRPYLYQAAPDVIFTELVDIYNSQVEAEKQFIVGTVTVTDPNDYVRLESTAAEQMSATLDKLVQRCGGYIIFTSNEDGARVINWYDAVSYANNQTVAFGENLTDFSRSVANDGLATRIVPYGAQDPETGEYLTIESVNDGLDYIEDEEAVALRGVITKPVFYDDVTEPLNLLRKAQADLAASKTLITSLTLTAVDLSCLGVSTAIAGDAIAGRALSGNCNKCLDAFREGDLIRVQSTPHGLDDEFLLTDRNVDLLNKANNSISLGKEVRTLTAQTAAGDQAVLDTLHKTERHIRSDYTLNIAQVVESTQQLLSSLIEQTSEAIKMEVSETYATNGDVESAISTSMEQLSNSFTFTFNELRTVIDANDAEAREHIVEQERYIRFEDGNITLGEGGNAMTLVLKNDVIEFWRNDKRFGWWDGVDFHTGNIVVEVEERAQLGNFAAVPRNNGHLSWLIVKN